MSRKLSGERDEVVRGDVREGVETRLHTTTAEPRFNVRWILSPHPWSSHLLRSSTLKLAFAQPCTGHVHYRQWGCGPP
jgi:hypothetical protein